MQKVSPDTRSKERFSSHANAETSGLRMMAEGGRGSAKLDVPRQLFPNVLALVRGHELWLRKQY